MILHEKEPIVYPIIFPVRLTANCKMFWLTSFYIVPTLL